MCDHRLCVCDSSGSSLHPQWDYIVSDILLPKHNVGILDIYSETLD